MKWPDRRAVAYHEAGHAAVAHALGVAVTRVTIVPRGAFAGRVHHGPATGSESITVSYAGPLAEARRLGLHLPFAHRTKGPRAPLAVAAYGGSYDLASAAEAAALGAPWADARERRAYLRWQWERARVEVGRHWPEIEAVAAALLAHETLTGAQVRRVIRAARPRKF